MFFVHVPKLPRAMLAGFPRGGRLSYEQPGWLVQQIMTYVSPCNALWVPPSHVRELATSHVDGQLGSAFPAPLLTISGGEPASQVANAQVKKESAPDAVISTKSQANCELKMFKLSTAPIRS